ncbi:MAG: DUF418 domain-containing protein [Acidobacteria bacterium]|nr:DUF418 domain-containing protein [Acidobacteriota bacterium]
MAEEIPPGSLLPDPPPAPLEAAATPLEFPEPIVVAEPAEPLGPTEPGERISLIDVLRGLALFGIIMANMRGFAGPLTSYFQPSLIWKTRVDFWVQTLIDTLVQGKFITIFAFLFGVGFAVQLTRAEKRHSGFARFYSRRLLALLLLGALHQLLFWWGDILLSYALGGFLLIPFRKRQNKTVLIWALSLMLLPVAGGTGFALYKRLRPDPPQKVEENKKKAAEDRQKSQADMWKTVKVYQSGNYVGIFKERLGELKRMIRSQPIVVVFTLPIFLLGLWVWRQGIFQDPEAHRSLLQKGLIIGALAGIPANIAFAWGSQVVSSQPQTGPPTPFMLFGFLLATFGRPALSMSYACAVGLLFLNEAWRRLLMPFAAIGRTALSNYLFQTVVCTTIFYGYGGALFAKVSLAWLLVPTVVIYALETPLSNWWLSRYRFGPAEWIWRSMTYGKVQPMKRGAL